MIQIVYVNIFIAGLLNGVKGAWDSNPSDPTIFVEN